MSYNFELSRLGYLMEYKPVVGMVVFYSVPDGKLYYDYVDNIYFRLKDAHEDDSWEQQDSVNIRIPVKNELTHQSVQQIHAYMRKTFTNFNDMYARHAYDHGLPIARTGLEKTTYLPPQNIPERALRQYGMYFYKVASSRSCFK
ncbi:DUF4365 domain-containing protein [Chitinophaga sedimenti]|uniref:DUF4365 domain-containing protein n=1 Tax=Chitinophaga sedimenti TaxID=2033606 RepID=UPI0027E1F1D8|nr:DUF4365 domain-containing protein [Chitinophaga sedimenti]